MVFSNYEVILLPQVLNAIKPKQTLLLHTFPALVSSNNTEQGGPQDYEYANLISRVDCGAVSVLFLWSGFIALRQL